MTKTLQEIQQENRRFIIKACNPDFDPERFTYPAYQITLNKVLLALQYKIQKTFHISGNEITFRYIDKNLDVSEIFWDLTKETIEEQSEETQRRINELLNNK